MHGHQIVPPGDVDSLCSVARAMDVDLLVTGHTHRFDAFEREGRFFVNPGSATGAWSAVWPILDGEEELKREEEEKEKKTDSSDKNVAESVAEKVAAKVDEKKDDAIDAKKKSEGANSVQTEAKEKKEANKESQEEPKVAAEPTPSFACKFCLLLTIDRESILY